MVPSCTLYGGNVQFPMVNPCKFNTYAIGVNQTAEMFIIVLSIVSKFVANCGTLTLGVSLICGFANPKFVVVVLIFSPHHCPTNYSKSDYQHQTSSYFEWLTKDNYLDSSIGSYPKQIRPKVDCRLVSSLP